MKNTHTYLLHLEQEQYERLMALKKEKGHVISWSIKTAIDEFLTKQDKKNEK
jgi:predicted DNA-binding protein